MIGSIVLSAVLFAAASLGWGFLFHAVRTRLSGKAIFLVSFFIAATSVLASVFLIKGLSEGGTSVGLVMASLVFALSLILSTLVGSALKAIRGISRLFVWADGLWKDDDEQEDPSDLVNEILGPIAETGMIDAYEKELIESILKFKDKIVHEVMVPRGDISAINIEEDPRRVLRRVAEEGYSRMPVYSGSIDNIMGVIYAKDLITMSEGSGAIVLQDLLRSPYYVPETKKISQLLREMQRNKVHLAIVVDEFGGTEGIVTLEDLLEEIVGEIQDEYDESLSELVRDENGDVHFSGLMTVERFNELLDGEIPVGEDYDTMAGFVQKLAGKLPQKGEVYNHADLYFVIEEVARHRIKRLKASLKEHPVSPSSLIETEDFRPPSNLSRPSEPVQTKIPETVSADSGKHRPGRIARNGKKRTGGRRSGVRRSKGGRKKS